MKKQTIIIKVKEIQNITNNQIQIYMELINLICMRIFKVALKGNKFKEIKATKINMKSQKEQEIHNKMFLC